MRQKPSRQQSEELYAIFSQGGRGPATIGRYVRLPNNDPGEDIDGDELLMHAQVGWQVLLFQHVRGHMGPDKRMVPWNPNAHSALSDAMAAVEHARGSGYPEGCHLFADAEGIDLGLAQPSQIALWYERWAAQVRSEGYRAGRYCGYDDGLTPRDRWLLQWIDQYASDQADHQVETRGTSYLQKREITLCGVRIDDSVLRADHLGDTPMVCVWQDEAA